MGTGTKRGVPGSPSHGFKLSRPGGGVRFCEEISTLANGGRVFLERGPDSGREFYRGEVECDFPHAAPTPFRISLGNMRRAWRRVPFSRGGLPTDTHPVAPCRQKRSITGRTFCFQSGRAGKLELACKWVAVWVATRSAQRF